MKKLITRTSNALALSVLLSASAMAIATDDRLIGIVSSIESSDNDQAVGDSGKARGRFQFHYEAWVQVSIQRRKDGLKAYPYAYAHDHLVSEQYFKDYLDWIKKSLTKRLGRPALAWEVYASYNRGVQGFANLRYNFSALPTHTQRSCKRIATELGEPL